MKHGISCAALTALLCTTLSTATTAARAQDANNRLPAPGRILAVRDFDGNSTPDLMFTRQNVPTFWYTSSTGTRSVGSRVVRQEATQSAPTGGWQIAGAGRFSPSSSPSLVLTHPTDRRIHLWHMDGSTRTGGEYVYFGNQPDLHMTLPQDAKFLGAADFDGDGSDDIAWFDGATRRIAIWNIHGAAVYSGHYIDHALPAGWNVIGMGQMDSTPSPELLLLGPNRELHIWQLNGYQWYNGAYVTTRSGSYATLPVGWDVAGMADFNGDGRYEIVIQNQGLWGLAYWQLTPNVSFQSTLPIQLGFNETGTDNQ